MGMSNLRPTLAVAAIVAVLIALVSSRMSAVGVRASWVELVLSAPQVVTETERAKEAAVTVLGEAKDAGLNQDAAEVERLADEVDRYLERFSTIERYLNRVEPVEATSTLAAMVDPLSLTQEDEVPVEATVPDDYAELLEHYSSLQQHMAFAVAQLEEAAERLAAETAQHRDVKEKTEEWEAARSELEERLAEAEKVAEEAQVYLNPSENSALFLLESKIAETRAQLSGSETVPDDSEVIAEDATGFTTRAQELGELTQAVLAEIEMALEAAAELAEVQEEQGPLSPTDTDSPPEPPAPAPASPTQPSPEPPAPQPPAEVAPDPTPGETEDDELNG